VVITLSGCATPGTPSPPFGLKGKGTPWTICCKEVQGPNRAQLVQQFAESLRNTPGVRPKDVFARDDADGFARLFYGNYWRRLDKKTGKHLTPAQLQHDLDMIRQLGDTSGQRYFAYAMLIRLPTDDVGNPAWNLAKHAGAYSLQVAVFEPSEDFWEFKQAAAEYCDYLRGNGYEAYYHHSPASSVVTVGLFGRDAVVPQPTGLPRYAEQVSRLQQEELLRYNRLNGAIYYLTGGNGQRTPVPSRLVEIPRESELAAP
jgi:hypothetical protein